MSDLRQAEQSVKVVGLLKENNLEKKEATIVLKDKTVMSTTSIGGNIVIGVGDKAVKVRLYQKAHKKDGSKNGIYAGYETMLNEYVSEVDVLNKYKDLELPDTWKSEVTVISINGELRENAFMGGNDLIVDVQINTTFVNRVNGEYTPKAEFTLEGFFSKIKEEVIKDEETGRLLVEMIIPAYGGRVFPVTLYAPEGDVADYLDSNYETGLSGKVWGDLDYTQKEERKVTKAGFGADKVEIIKTSKKEMIITGGIEEQYDEDSEKSFDKALIRQAMSERENYFEELKEKGKDTEKKKEPVKKATSSDFPF